MMPGQGYRRQQGDDLDDVVVAAAPTTAPSRAASAGASAAGLAGDTAATADAVVPASTAAAPCPSRQQQQQLGRDGDADSLLEVNGRTGSRVPLLLGWAQLLLGLIGCTLGLSDAGYRSGHANITVVVFNEPRTARPFDVTAAFGFSLWCSVSMIVSSILALWYSKTSLQRLLYLYRLYSLVNLAVLSIGLILVVLSWICQLDPGSNKLHLPLRVLLALNSVLLITSWILVLACVLCDFCVGKNLLQVLGIFFRTVCHKSQRDSFSELKRSNNSLNVRRNSLTPSRS